MISESESAVDAGAEFDPAPGSDGLGDPYYPGLGNAGYDVDRYILDLDWDPETTTLDGIVTIEAVTTQDLSRFNLDLSGMEVRSVTVDGTEAQFEREESELTVDLPTALPEGTAFSTLIDYGGHPGRVPALSDIDIGGWYNEGGNAFVVSEPAGSFSWHPV
ncbi:MAG: M1 family metallopeptidase, partial [Actinomycetia bacterium]|nr:M1 family metallopeptidase [Actinomycetes bacterium]